MALIPNSQGENDSKKPDENMPGGAIVSWVMDRVRHGRNQRDAQYADRWKEYTRIWRGYFVEKDKTTNSERSRLISPASAQAVEMTVSEMEEATFGRTAWVDITDDIADEQRDDAIAYRDQLLEDFEFVGAQDAIADAYLLGCIYGTGILKLMVDLSADESREIQVKLEAIRPDEFVIDPAACDIDAAGWCAHEPVKPLHGIKEKQRRGIYNNVPLQPYTGTQKGNTTGLEGSSLEAADDAVLITEFYGKVPGILIGEGEGMVEAIVTIANERALLRAVRSPFQYEDRPIVAYPHDPVPGEFWGRGVIEKGYNPQKALDAELRARIDGLALMTAPMMGADITRMPKNPDLRTRPGKWLLTRGKPSDIVEPIAFQAPQFAQTFQNASDLERMVQMATGAMDSAIPIGQNRRNETAGGMSMMQSGFLKRSKRTMRRVEKFLDKVVTRSLWRYMQFEPERYPVDMKFVVNSTMGMMAREVENQQLVQMLGFVPPESPAHSLIIQALFENTNSAEKDVLKQAIEAMNKPPSEEEQQMAQMQKELQLRAMKAEVEEKEMTVAKLKAETELALAKAHGEMVDADLADDLVEIQAANAVTAAAKARVADRQVDASLQKVEADKKKAESKSKA